MRPPLFSSIARLGIRPDQPAEGPPAVVGPRPRHSRRPHTDATVATIRRLIEQTTLTYGEIAAQTKVGRASICRWTRDGGWKRPAFAPRATDTVPRARASAQLKRRRLAARLDALAERHIRELEDSACVDPEKLAEALELLKMAKLAGRPKRRRDAAVKAAEATQIFAASPRGVMKGLRSAGVRVERAPEDALEDFIASRAPPPAKPRRGRGRMSRLDAHHAWMLEKERP